MLAECYYRLEHYDTLRLLVDTVPDGTESELLTTIGSRFTAVGLAVDAVAAYIKAGNVKAAIDAAVLVSAWDCAVELAERYEFPQLEGLLAKYAARLLAQGERLQAVELYRKANKVTTMTIHTYVAVVSRYGMYEWYDKLALIKILNFRRLPLSTS
jgi:WD repeat-containing protein 35